MRKYIQTFKTSLQKAVTYKSVEFIWIISAFITPLLFMSLWSQNKDSPVEGMNLSEMVTYYLVITLISQLVSPHIDWDVVNDINKGTLNFYLVKPYKYLIQLFIQEFAWKIISYLGNIIPLGIFIIIYKEYLILPSLGISKILFVLLICILSYVLMFLLQFSIGCLAFWITEIRAFLRILYMTSDLFAGRLFPLILMPPILKTIGGFLPFKYFWYYPTMVILGKQDLVDIKVSFFILIFWLLLFAFIVNILWKRGLKTYSSYGG